MQESEARERFSAAPFAVLGTLRPDGRPHLVPITFVVVGDAIVTAVDHKPKTTRHLRRLKNVQHDRRVCVLVDHRDDDWSGLWWVRADGWAEIYHRLLPEWSTALAAKYPPYADVPPTGPALRITVERFSWWSSA